jgi:hypothetical protein
MTRDSAALLAANNHLARFAMNLLVPVIDLPDALSISISLHMEYLAYRACLRFLLQGLPSSGVSIVLPDGHHLPWTNKKPALIGSVSLLAPCIPSDQIRLADHSPQLAYMSVLLDGHHLPWTNKNRP